MNLRTKLLSGYLIFVAALVVLGGWSAWRLREMGGVSRRIIANNYDSVIAAQNMKESLERQDSAALFALLGAREKATTQLHEHRARFDAEFKKAENNITEVGERESIDSIRRERDTYYSMFDTFMVRVNATEIAPDKNVARGDQELAERHEYFARLEPQFNKLRAECEHLLQLNQRAMLGKSEAAAGVAQLWFYRTLLFASVLVVAGLALAFFLANRIVEPLRQLTATTARIAGGDLNAKVTVSSRDEVGLLAAEYNRMAERIRQLRSSDMGQLLVSQQTTEAAIDSLYDPVIVTDGAGCVTKLNPAAEEIFGSEKENSGKHVGEVARDARVAGAVAEALQSQRPVAGEGMSSVLPLAVDGSQKAFRLRTTPMRDNGHLLGAVTILEDITHLREIDRLKSEFIATASHELRTPLTSVQMGVHLLLEGALGELTDQQNEVLQACRQDCERLDKLMRDLLDLSRIEAGETQPRLAAVSARDLLTTAIRELRPQVETKGLRLNVVAPIDLPSVRVDRLQIERVVSNLVSNALRHMQRGEIKISAERRDSQLAVSVSDSGSGIPTEYLAHIFDRFVQVPDGPTGGAGLGLAISKSIVEAHGGQISAQSQVGRGTTFTFTLPLAKGPSSRDRLGAVAPGEEVSR